MTAQDMDNLYENYIDATWAYIKEQAADPEVEEIEVNMPASEIPLKISDTNGWQVDFWCDETMEISGRQWEVSGCAWYGSVTFRIPEEG